MFSSSGPHLPKGKHDICSSYLAADRFLTANGTDEYTFGRQAGSLRRLTALQTGSLPAIALRYHNTNVVILYADKQIEFHTGGWKTISTANWMSANHRFAIDLYAPRNELEERKPFRYSSIRFRGHDRNIERTLRDEWNLPTFEQDSYLWESDGRYSDFHSELSRRKSERHPWYVFHEGIRFTNRGRCVYGGGEHAEPQLLSEALEQERTERDAATLEKRQQQGRLLAYTNRVVKAMEAGMDANPLDCIACHAGHTAHLPMHIEDGEVPAALIFRAVREHGEGDTRMTLGLHGQGTDLRIGMLHANPPFIRTAVQKYLHEALLD